jgi:GWxTD domain-containing protein
MRTSLIIIAAVVLADGCSPRAYSPAIRHGADFSIFGSTGRNRLELPSLALRVSAVGFVNLNGQPSLRVAAAIGQAGLQFSGSGKAAYLGIHIRAKGAVDTTVTDTLTVIRRDFQPGYSYSVRLHVPPGRYDVQVQLADVASGTHISRKARAVVPASKNRRLGPVRAAAKDSSGWHPLAVYDVAGRIDSLRFTVRAARNSGSAAPLAIRAYLLRFRADSSVATAMPYSWSDPRYDSSSLVYKGIDYEDSTVIRAERRTLISADPVQIRFQFKAPPKGNYRFEVQAAGKMRARDFAMRSPDFPEVRTPHERAAPLAGLMKSSSYRKLMKVSDPDSLRAAVTRFWRAQMDGQQAFLVAALYYQRVRQANRLFTNYKEGWKTDRGVIYILFGPPDRMSDFRTSFFLGYATKPPGPYKVWVYLGQVIFKHYLVVSLPYFVQVQSPSAGFPFEHFMTGTLALKLADKWGTDWVRTQQHLWKSGQILHWKFRRPLIIDPGSLSW